MGNSLGPYIAMAGQGLFRQDLPGYRQGAEQAGNYHGLPDGYYGAIVAYRCYSLLGFLNISRA